MFRPKMGRIPLVTSLAAFRESPRTECVIAGDYLRSKYKDSTRVKPTRGGRLRLHRRSVRIPTANDLVFIKESPDYCHHNSTTGSLGETEQCYAEQCLSANSELWPGTV